MVTAHQVCTGLAVLVCVGAAGLPAHAASNRELAAPERPTAQQIPKDCAVSYRNSSKYIDEWRRIEAPQGSSTGAWGSLRWTRTRVDIDVRAGYVLDVCVSERAGVGIVFGQDFSVGGPDTVTERTDNVFVVGFGALEGQLAPTRVDAGL